MGEPTKPGTTPSLPGAMSTRTDGAGSVASKQAIRYAAGEPGAENFYNLQSQAPLSASGQMPKPSAAGVRNAAMGGAPQPGQPGPTATPLLAPNMNGNMPFTSGNPLGAGPGLDSLGLMPNAQMGGVSARNTVQAAASRPDASPELQHLAAQLGQ